MLTFRNKTLSLIFYKLSPSLSLFYYEQFIILNCLDKTQRLKYEINQQQQTFLKVYNGNIKYQLKQIITKIICISNTELKQRTHYENDRISISHIPILNIFRVAEYRH